MSIRPQEGTCGRVDPRQTRFVGAVAPTDSFVTACATYRPTAKRAPVVTTAYFHLTLRDGTSAEPILSITITRPEAISNLRASQAGQARP